MDRAEPARAHAPDAPEEEHRLLVRAVLEEQQREVEAGVEHLEQAARALARALRALELELLAQLERREAQRHRLVKVAERDEQPDERVGALERVRVAIAERGLAQLERRPALVDRRVKVAEQFERLGGRVLAHERLLVLRAVQREPPRRVVAVDVVRLPVAVRALVVLGEVVQRGEHVVLAREPALLAQPAQAHAELEPLLAVEQHREHEDAERHAERAGSVEHKALRGLAAAHAHGEPLDAELEQVQREHEERVRREELVGEGGRARHA